MTNVNVSTELTMPADAVWATIGSFGALARWHPAVRRCDEETKNGATIRTLTLADGGKIVERLEGKDDGSRTYTYSIVESPLPVKGYVSKLSVQDAGSGRSKVEWSSNFEPAGVGESDAVNVIRGIYEAGFQNLRKMMGA